MTQIIVASDNTEFVEVHSGGALVKLLIPSLQQLKTWVAAHCALFVENKEPFTAYSVTIALRDPNNTLTAGSSNYYIPHLDTDDVAQHIGTSIQSMVHWLMMSPEMQNNLKKFNMTLDTDTRYWGADGMDDANGNPALTYFAEHSTSTPPSFSVDDNKIVLPDSGVKILVFTNNNNATMPQPTHTTQIAWPDIQSNMYGLPAGNDDTNTDDE